MRKVGAILAVLAVIAAVPAFGSGGPPPEAKYIDRRGGSEAELARLWRGRTGVLLARAPQPMLYLHWRLLHGLEVGAEAGAALSVPCCDFGSTYDPHAGVYGWLEARAAVAGPSETSYLPTERPGPDYTSIPNCFPDAFDNAAATLRDRAQRYGAASPAVRAWLAGQDAVFDACARPEAALPPVIADAPAWLNADRAYQEAAFTLYQGRNLEAAERFAAIGRDRASPWRPMGLYLSARAVQREAIARRTPEAYERARAAIARLAAAPDGSYGKAEARKMQRALAYRERPLALLAELDHELGERAPSADIAVSLRDYLGLASAANPKPDAADWIATLIARDRAPALAHANERWAATHDPAWLLAALSLANPGDESAPALAADVGRVARDSPAWLSAQYHQIRLTFAAADPAATRARLDALLARDDLSLSERNLFMAARAQRATDLADLARFALRRAYCLQELGQCVEDADWAIGPAMLARTADGQLVGLGADARAVIDRLPLDDRIALSRNPVFPAAIRLDLALTGFARAVQLQDEAAILGLAGDLVTLLPPMAADWRRIAATAPGPDRRFAEYFALAKIPGLRPDLTEWGYTRPEGTIAQFQGQWTDWHVLPRGGGAGAATAPSPARYINGYWTAEGGEDADLACLDRCGAGAFPLSMPPFAATGAARAGAEHAHFLTGGTDMMGNRHPLPAGAVPVWEEVLAWARAHPADPRAPEALYWLIRIARWGANHDHIGKRAFELLHQRYARTDWARRSPYYYDP